MYDKLIRGSVLKVKLHRGSVDYAEVVLTTQRLC